MWSGVMVSSATNAGPGNLTDGVLTAFAPAPPSAQEGRLSHKKLRHDRLRHTLRHAETILGFPCINSGLSPNKAAPLREGYFLKVWDDCNGGWIRDCGRSGERASTRVQTLPAPQV